MSPPRKTLLRPLGLMTQPAKFGWYKDGALQRAINCVMRNPGELDAAPSMFASTNTGNPLLANQTLHKLVPLDSGHVYTLSVDPLGNWQIYENGSAVTLPSTFVTVTDLFSETGRISPARARDRMLLNSDNGILVGDYMAPSNATERALRVAGLPQLTIVSASTTSAASPSGAVPANTPYLVFGYVAIHTREFSDGYILTSVPTPAIKRFGTTALDVTASVTVKWATSDVMEVGDVIELYRTDGLPTGDVNVDPSTTYKLVRSHTITATDLSTGSYAFLDASRMGDAPYFQTTGRELYTNPGQGGATSANRQPPLANSVATFDGRAFYGNTTDRPKLSFKIPAGVGFTGGTPICDTAYWRTNGIGTRVVASNNATVVNGSPVITGLTAANLAGVVPGQAFALNPGSSFASGTVVSSVNVGAGTLTMSSNYTGPNSSTFSVILADVIYIAFNGGPLFPYRFGEQGDFLASLAGLQGANGYSAPANRFEVTSSQAAYMAPLNATTFTGMYSQNVAYTLEPRNYAQFLESMQVMATNGANYSPPIAEYTLTPGTLNANITQCNRTPLKNFLTWSKDQQPEHVPADANSTFVGLRELIAMASTRDALWIACLDGIFRLTGIGGQYRLDQVDSTKIICAPQAMCVLDEDVYLYTNFGLFQMNSERRTNLTDEVIGDLLPGPEYKEIPTIQLAANETDLEVLVLDVSSDDRLYVYATRDSGGWTTLENNGTALSNITSLAFQRSPASGESRLLIGVSQTGGGVPSYAGWGNTASFLAMDVLFQPIYQNDPISLKHWIEASYIFDAGNAGKTLRPVWNGTPVGSANIALYQNAAYARAGVPRDAAISQSIMVGFDSVSTPAPQARFLGVSVMYWPLTTQAKQRG